MLHVYHSLQPVKRRAQPVATMHTPARRSTVKVRVTGLYKTSWADPWRAEQSLENAFSVFCNFEVPVVMFPHDEAAVAFCQSADAAEQAVSRFNGSDELGLGHLVAELYHSPSISSFEPMLDRSMGRQRQQHTMPSFQHSRESTMLQNQDSAQVYILSCEVF